MDRTDGPQFPTRYKPLTRANIERSAVWERMSPDVQHAVRVVSAVLPFRANEYVVDHLIDWDAAADDPIFQLTFPQRDMLTEEDFSRVERLLDAGDKPALDAEVNRIRLSLNPHPAGQVTHNVPKVDGRPVPGIQHKYRQTVLFFPSHGQTCHAYCTFCFRWAQFVGMEDLKFASKEVDDLIAYLKRHPEVSDVLITGGDPMIMKTKVLARYLEALIDADLEHLQTIRIGTKSVAYWPQRFVTDDDADDCLRLFERVTNAGLNLAIMGHYSHPVELSTEIAQEAVRRIRATGANVRMQSPCIRHVNDDPDVWADLWQRGVRLGAIPYYMFVERDTGARRYFELPLARVWEIFRAAYQQVSGLARTVRGPSMSAFPGKVHILGVTEVGEEKAFVLEYLQARRAGLVRQPFFASFDPDATWFDQLEPLTERDADFWPREQPRTIDVVDLTQGGMALQ